MISPGRRSTRVHRSSPGSQRPLVPGQVRECRRPVRTPPSLLDSSPSRVATRSHGRPFRTGRRSIPGPYHGEVISIHPSAEVEEGAEVGPGSRIWHLAHVRQGARIGRDCVIGRNVYVDAGVTVGDRCKIQNNVSVYHGVSLEDEVFVGPSAVFTNDHNPRAVGDWEIAPTLVREGASIGAGAVLVCGVTIGRGALVGAGAVVTRDVPDWTLMVGNPARPVGLVCEHGLPTVRSGGRCDGCTAKGQK